MTFSEGCPQRRHLSFDEEFLLDALADQPLTIAQLEPLFLPLVRRRILAAVIRARGSGASINASSTPMGVQFALDEPADASRRVVGRRLASRCHACGASSPVESNAPRSCAILALLRELDAHCVRRSGGTNPPGHAGR
jgi:hypothetical protein